MSDVESALAIVLGVAFLFALFQAVRVEWPDSYFGASDLGAYFVSASPFRYLAFRLGPVFATCLFIAVTSARRGSSPFVGSLAVASIHALLTSGVALVTWARWPRKLRRHRFPIAMMRATSLVLIPMTGFLAALSADPLAPIVPRPSELAETLWTAAIAAVLGAYLMSLSRSAGDSATRLVHASIDRVPRRLWDLAEEVAAEYGADVELVRAVMVVENLERPKWFRHIERLKSFVSKPGTYGIMQAMSDRFLSDEESLRKVVAERLRHVNVRDDYEARRSFAMSYNPDPNFAELLDTAMWETTQRAPRRHAG
jgi:hypothetical protein